MSDRRIAVCPGTYDPVTKGHVDIIERSSRIFDEVIVAVAIGSTRKVHMFNGQERMQMVREACTHLTNIRVEGFNKLIIAFARQFGATALVKGLRAISDFDYEFQMAQINKHLAAEIETVYLPASPQFSFISSSGVREVAAWGGNVEDWVPAHVAEALRQKLDRRLAG
jgi:pantetheine-phosphate adenylyltransferase